LASALLPTLSAANYRAGSDICKITQASPSDGGSGLLDDRAREVRLPVLAFCLIRLSVVRLAIPFRAAS